MLELEDLAVLPGRGNRGKKKRLSNRSMAVAAGLFAVALALLLPLRPDSSHEAAPGARALPTGEPVSPAAPPAPLPPPPSEAEAEAEAEAEEGSLAASESGGSPPSISGGAPPTRPAGEGAPDVEPRPGFRSRRLELEPGLRPAGSAVATFPELSAKARRELKARQPALDAPSAARKAGEPSVDRGSFPVLEDRK